MINNQCFMTIILSKTISSLRTALSFLIVFLHAAITGLSTQELEASYDGPYKAYEYVSGVLTMIARVGVPLFFIISGYLFFISYKNTWEDYKHKITSRFFHLVQPIVIWTSLYLILYCVAQQLPYTKDLFSGQNLLIADYDWKDFIGAYTGIFNNSYMFVGQFWFLRNLFVICLFAPMLWYIYKYTKIYGLFAFGIIWLFHDPLEINIFVVDTLFFFTLGAWIALAEYDVECFIRLSARKFYPLYILLLIVTTLSHGSAYNHYFYQLTVLSGTICMSHICYQVVNKGYGSVLVWLAPGSYFCFLLHQQVQMFVRGLYKLVNPDNSLTMLLMYFLIPCLIIFICYCLFAYLRKYHSSVLAVLTGTQDRIKS